MTPIVKTAIGLALGLGAIVGALLLVPAPQPAAPAAASKLTIPFDDELAQRGATLFTSKGCAGCHALSSLKIAGGTAGPDLSRVLLGEVPPGTSPEANPIARWYAESGLTDPETDLEQAAELLEEYLEGPPPYSPLMSGQIQRLAAAAGGDVEWKRDVRAIVELFKKAATAR